MKRTFYFFAALGLVCTLAGCETVKGVGRDITGASSSVQDAMSRRK